MQLCTKCFFVKHHLEKIHLRCSRPDYRKPRSNILVHEIEALKAEKEDHVGDCMDVFSKMRVPTTGKLPCYSVEVRDGEVMLFESGYLGRCSLTTCSNCCF